MSHIVIPCDDPTEALRLVLEEMQSMDPVELRRQLDDYKYCDFACTLGEMTEYLTSVVGPVVEEHLSTLISPYFT